MPVREDQPLFDVSIQDLDQNGTLRPGITASFNHEQAAPIIDTGASYHVHFIDQNELQNKPLDKNDVLMAQYFGGHSIIGTDQFEIEIAGFNENVPKDGKMLVPPAGFVLHRGGLSTGLLSPQSLGSGITAILDFPHRRFIAIKGNLHQAENWYKTHVNPYRFTSLKADTAKDRVFVVSAGLEGRPATDILLDTGAFITHFRKSYAQPLSVTSEKVEVHDVWGNIYQTEAASNQKVTLAGQIFTLSTVALDGPLANEEKAQGIIGMDILQHAVMIVPYHNTNELLISFDGKLN